MSDLERDLAQVGLDPQETAGSPNGATSAGSVLGGVRHDPAGPAPVTDDDDESE
jgi:hypothetical protein